MTNEQYDRLSAALAKGHSIRVNEGSTHRIVTRQEDLDALFHDTPQSEVPSPRDERKAQLGKLSKSELTTRAGELQLPTDGSKEDLAARILEMEFPPPQE